MRHKYSHGMLHHGRSIEIDAEMTMTEALRRVNAVGGCERSLDTSRDWCRVVIEAIVLVTLARPMGVLYPGGAEEG